jgi:hypothetical protein
VVVVAVVVVVVVVVVAAVVLEEEEALGLGLALEEGSPCSSTCAPRLGGASQVRCSWLAAASQPRACWSAQMSCCSLRGRPCRALQQRPGSGGALAL